MSIANVDSILDQKDIANIVNDRLPDASGNYRKVWVGNHKVLKFDPMEPSWVNYKEICYLYHEPCKVWLPELHYYTQDYKFILVEKLTTVSEDPSSVYDAAKVALGPVVDFFLEDKKYKSKEEAWDEGVRVYLSFLYQVQMHMESEEQFNASLNFLFSSRYPRGYNWFSLLSKEIKTLVACFQSDVITDLHHKNIGANKKQQFKLLDFGGYV
jgi:hypothetical protein